MYIIDYTLLSIFLMKQNNLCYFIAKDKNRPNWMENLQSQFKVYCDYCK